MKSEIREVADQLVPIKKVCDFVAFVCCVIAPLDALGAGRYGNHTAAEFERHVRELKKKLPGEGFTVVVTPPFVVIGDVVKAQHDRLALENRFLKDYITG